MLRQKALDKEVINKIRGQKKKKKRKKRKKKRRNIKKLNIHLSH
jgi:hypothetical protein